MTTGWSRAFMGEGAAGAFCTGSVDAAASSRSCSMCRTKGGGESDVPLSSPSMGNLGRPSAATRAACAKAIGPPGDRRQPHDAQQKRQRRAEDGPGRCHRCGRSVRVYRLHLHRRELE